MATANIKKRVMVSGCYDLIHSGHVTFFETAAAYGDLHVCLGSDANIALLKGKPTRFNEQERLYMVSSIRHVHQARISRGMGYLDFEPEMAELRPDLFIVNHDGASEEKRQLCHRYGAEYLELPRVPRPGLPAQSSSSIKAQLRAEAAPNPVNAEPPYRLCLAGGWIDQPFVSRHHGGSVVVVNILPTRDFNLRSGMATSSRNHWKKIFHHNLLPHNPAELARLLFGYENPPGTRYISGSQDHIGLTHPGISRLDYDGDYWPHHVESCTDPEICRWLEDHIRLVELFERPDGYDPLLKQNLSIATAARLGKAGRDCWDAIMRKDLHAFGAALTESYDATRDLLPLTTNDRIDAALNRCNPVCTGRTTSGCGGGYIYLATDRKDIPGAFGIQIRSRLG